MPVPRFMKNGPSGKAVSQKSASESAHVKHHPPQQDEQLQVLRQKVETLQADLSRRQERYIRRERAFNMKIEELEEEVENLKSGKMSWMQGNDSMESLKGMHQQILHNVEMVQDRSSKILQEQERDLLRAFRARLFDVQTELEREKSRKDGGDNAWVERARQTEAELDWTKEMADRLDRVNQGLSRENLRLKSQFKSQEDDREFLIRQLVTIKKESRLLRQEAEATEVNLDEMRRKVVADAEDMEENVRRRPRTSVSSPNLQAPALGALASRQAGANADSRYKEIIKRLKRLLETERRNLRQARSSYASELQQRTELENLLRASVDEVRHELAAEKKMLARAAGGVASGRRAPGPGDISIASFSRADREHALEMLLARERVLTLLYAKTFPLSTPTRPEESSDGGESPAEGDSGEQGAGSGNAVDADAAKIGG